MMFNKFTAHADKPALGLHKMQSLTVNAAKGRFFSNIKQQGFSLVELMVALGIGTLIALAISTLFFQVFTGSRTADDASRASEAGSFALRVLGEDFRMSGFVGLSDGGASIQVVRSNLVGGAAADNCGSPRWFLPLDDATNRVNFIQHLTNPASLPCIPAANVAAGSPAIVLRGATGREAQAADFATNRMFIQANQGGGIVFQGVDYAANVKGAGLHNQVCRHTPGPGACADTAGDRPCRCPTTGVNAGRGSVALVDTPILEYNAHVYYVRPCSRPAGATCTATDDNNEPIPTLVRRQLTENIDPAVFVETPIAEGVERMTVSYGLDTDGNCVPETYTDSTTIFTPISPNLDEVVTVRVSLLMRTRKPENNYDDSVNTYTLADGSTFNCAVNLASCRHHRYILTDTVQVKNNALRRC